MIDDVRASANQVENQTKRINKSISGIKSFVAKATAGLGLFKLGQEAIQVASNIQEVQNVVDTAFGRMSWKAEKFAKTSITQFGMSELSAKKTASTYMAMARGMGLNDDVASDMAITMAGLTGDVASFYNISQELADVKLKSVFTGETETLKDLGIVMTQTNLKQFALSQGITKNINDMSQAELTTLRYKFVMQQLSMAQGDFAKTGGSWANQLRILQEQWKQLLGIIGNGLIAVLTPVIQVINAVIAKIISFANIISAVFGKLFGKSGDKKKTPISSMSSDAAKAQKSIGGVGKSLDKAGSKAKKAAKEAKGFLAGFDDLNIMTSTDTAGSSGGGNSSGGSGGAGYDIGSNDWGKEPDTSGVDKAIDKIIKKIEEFKKYISKNIPLITSLIAGIASGFIAFETIMHWGAIVAFLTKLVGPFQWLAAAVSTLVGSITEGSGILVGLQAVFGTLAGTATFIAVGVGAITAALVYLYQTSESFREIVGEAISSTVDVLLNLYNSCVVPIFEVLKNLFTNVLVPIVTLLSDVFVVAVESVSKILLAFWKDVIVPIANIIVNVFGVAIQRICGLIEDLMPAIQGVIDFLLKLWNKVLNPLVSFLTNIVLGTLKIIGDFLGWLGPYIVDLFGWVLDFFTGVFTGDFTAFIEGFKGWWDDAVNFIYKIFSPIGEWFKIQWRNVEQAFSNVGKFFSDVFNGAYKNVITAFSSIGTFFKGCWSNIKSAFGNVSTWFKDTFSKAWTAVKNVFSTGGKIFDGIKDGILSGLKAVVNAIITGINKVIKIPFDGLNSALRKIKSVNILGLKPFNWISTIKVPQIPKLAQGGVVNRATLGVFGEVGTEAVIPLKKNTQGLDMIAEKISARLPVGNTQGGTYVINVVLEGGERLARMVIKNIKEYEVKTGEPVFDY